MVKVTFEPTNELIIHDILRVEREDLLRERVTPAGTMPLCWCDGMVYGFSSMPLTDDGIKDFLKGKIHWMEVHYSEMPDYKPVMPLSEEEYKAPMNVRIIDTSASQLHRDFAKWLKANAKR